MHRQAKQLNAHTHTHTHCARTRSNLARNAAVGCHSPAQRNMRVTFPIIGQRLGGHKHAPYCITGILKKLPSPGTTKSVLPPPANETHRPALSTLFSTHNIGPLLRPFRKHTVWLCLLNQHLRRQASAKQQNNSNAEVRHSQLQSRPWKANLLMHVCMLARYDTLSKDVPPAAACTAELHARHSLRGREALTAAAVLSDAAK